MDHQNRNPSPNPIRPPISLSLSLFNIDLINVATLTRCNSALTLVISVGTDLEADGQVGDVQMGGGACQATVLAGAGTRLTGLVAGPTDAALVREAARRTTAYASAAKRWQRWERK